MFVVQTITIRSRQRDKAQTKETIFFSICFLQNNARQFQFLHVDASFPALTLCNLNCLALLAGESSAAKKGDEGGEGKN